MWRAAGTGDLRAPRIRNDSFDCGDKLKDQDVQRAARELIKFYGAAAKTEALQRAGEAIREGKPGIAAVWELVGDAVEGQMRRDRPAN